MGIADSETSKIDRLFHLIFLVQRGIGRKERLCQELRVTERTLYRYLKTLEQLGAVLYYDEKRGYCFNEKVLMKPLFFSPGQLMAVAQCIEAFSQQENPLSEPLLQAKERIVSLLAPEKQAALDEACKAVSVQLCAGMRQIDKTIFYKTEEAIMSRKRLKIYYMSASRQDLQWRKVDPYFIQFRQGCWYLVAWCHSRQAHRTFRVDRIQKLQITEESFTPSDSITAEEYFSNSLGVSQGEPVKVVLRFTPERAKWLKDSSFHPSQQQKELPGGYLEVFLKVCIDWSLMRFVLGFGADVEVVEPMELREQVKEESKKMAYKHMRTGRSIDGKRRVYCSCKTK